VTELVTGIDLVEQMIRVAAGEKLKLEQAGVKLDGWAVETRVYAEDPVRNFLPSIGRLVRYRPPAETSAGGVTVRNDTGVYEGGEISLYYDPMIAKLVTHAPTREQAIAAQADALDAFAIEGIRHNISFLSALMQHPRWQEGKLSTAFLAEEFPHGFHPLLPEGETARVLAAVAAAADHVLGERKRRISGQQPGSAVTRERRRVVRLGDAELVLDITREGERFAVQFDGHRKRPRFLASTWTPGDPTWSGTIDDRRVGVQVRPVPNGFDLSHRGVETRAYVYTEREAAAARLMPAKKAADSGKAVRCPMPGLVVSIAVLEGQEVKAGETLAVVEAMKMENVLRAERDGVVKAIRAKPGDSLAVDAVIMEFA
jgi:propionyl-CoA carboxylase alpha chain